MPEDSEHEASLEKAVEKAGYKKFFSYAGMTAWVYKERGIASVGIVHPPFCVVLFSHEDSGRAAAWHVIAKQAERAQMAHVLQAIIQYFIHGGKIKTRQSVWGNFLFAFAMRIYLLKNLHLHPYVATLFGKNMLCTFGNLFNPNKNYHSLRASKNGSTRRQQLAAGRTASHNKDRHKSQHCQNHLSLSGHDGVDDLSDRIKRVHNRMTVYGEATTQRVGDRIHKTDQERNLKTLFDDWVNEKSETGKKIRNLMNQEQTQHSEDLSEEQNQKYSKLKEQFQKDEDNF